MFRMVRLESRRGPFSIVSRPIGDLSPVTLSAASVPRRVVVSEFQGVSRRSLVDIAVNTTNTAIPTHQCRRHALGNFNEHEVPPSTLYMGLRSPQSSPSADCLVAYRSEQGLRLLLDCLQSGSNENYMSLSEQFLTQSSPPSCGVATLAMVLNSLRIDPGRVWRKPWRWFTEETLISCFPLEKSEQELGLTIEHFGLIAECNGATAQTFYGSSTGLEDFRNCLEAVFVPAAWERRLVVAFDRGVLGQTGTGHYSPIGAYHKESDMVLVMDVARFKYPPYWVPVEEMWKAMRTLDPESRRSRGFFILSRSPIKRREEDSEEFTKIDTPRFQNVISALLDPQCHRLKAIAADLVHDIRKRILSCSCDLLIDCSAHEGGRSLLQRLRAIESVNECLKIGAILQVAVKSEADMRPIDFFIQSMPQFVHELVTLLILEQGHQFIRLEALADFLNTENGGDVDYK